MSYRVGTSLIFGVMIGLSPILLSACGTTPPMVEPATHPATTARSAKKTPASQSSKSPSPAPVTLLDFAASTQDQEPVHLAGTITNSLGNADIRMAGAVDPLNKESDFTMRSTLSGMGGVNPVTVVARMESIGSHYWAESTPPGGGWHAGTIAGVNPSFPLQEFLPYIVNVHAVPGKAIRGHLTHGVSATLDTKGVRLLEEVGTDKTVSAAQQIIQSVTFTLWIGPGHHPRELALVEDCVQDGHPYEVFETINYTHWGQGIDLTPPAASS
ncbi:MAG: hypothetical protein C7B46_02650 [Sulfobacillus benefaciens]|uniref:LppX_LprAFG lipoprotein n=1 Tax=Sulfobacillus benefaciens TaxID=453960 RepID=A0A2T2XKQ4_9FIRM|nr:MAG: hypothetical protein C7B46_02650 [Sulfobacillus benefaciens]